MSHQVSPPDRHFIGALEAAALTPAEFNHRAHVRAAYIYLAEADAERAADRLRATPLGFLERHGIASSMYHATMTKAGSLAVRHFMARGPDAASADAFTAAHPVLLDARIMLTHYSVQLLFSPETLGAFIEPDQSPIPGYA